MDGAYRGRGIPADRSRASDYAVACQDTSQSRGRCAHGGRDRIPRSKGAVMAAIPPFHEDPPVGTNNVVPAPGPDVGPDDKEASPPQPGPQAAQSSALPADWSPVTPSPAPGETVPTTDSDRKSTRL